MEGMRTEYILDRKVKEEKWGQGPWTDEPDVVEWQHTRTGLPCLLVRQPKLGVWLGAVGVPSSHPLYRVPFAVVDVKAHGGLSISSKLRNKNDARKNPSPEFFDHWYFGFDAARLGDLIPSMHALPHDSTYRDFRYMRSVAEDLAEQLAGRA